MIEDLSLSRSSRAAFLAIFGGSLALGLALASGSSRADAAESSVATVAAHKGLTLAGARSLIAAGEEEARIRHTTGAIAIVDEGGNLIAVDRLDGTFAAGPNIATGKARTAAHFRKPTRFFEDVIAKGRTAMTALPDFTPLAGGIPLFVDGELVGAVGVSGAASAKEDEELAEVAAKALGRPASAVHLIDKATVTAAFAKGEPLLETADYKIHASHRDHAGKAEIHAADTDILYMLSGSATLVTGGSVVDPVTVEPGEIRGGAIKGGERRLLAAGDVVVVPKGTPHWFASVSGPIDYYAVKVH
jgi:glc operon protein GlcG